MNYKKNGGKSESMNFHLSIQKSVYSEKVKNIIIHFNILNIYREVCWKKVIDDQNCLLYYT